MPGSELRRLLSPANSSRQPGEDVIFFVTEHGYAVVHAGVRKCAEHPFDQRPAVGFEEDFGAVAPHPGAFAGGKDTGLELGHSTLARYGTGSQK
jgi:hypothetical protein